MATEKQIEANRRNAQKSTGPATEAGKAKARFNALKHGMTAGTAVLPYEDPHSYDQLREALIDNYQPVGAGEQMLVELVIVNYWRLLRARRVEQASMRLHIEALKNRHEISTAPSSEDDAGLAAAFANPNTFRNLDRYQAGVERSYYRAVETLRKAQNDRKREEYRHAPKVVSLSKKMAVGATCDDPARLNTQAPAPQAGAAEKGKKSSSSRMVIKWPFGQQQTEP